MSRIKQLRCAVWKCYLQRTISSTMQAWIFRHSFGVVHPFGLCSLLLFQVPLRNTPTNHFVKCCRFKWLKKYRCLQWECYNLCILGGIRIFEEIASTTARTLSDLDLIFYIILASLSQSITFRQLQLSFCFVLFSCEKGIQQRRSSPSNFSKLPRTFVLLAPLFCRQLTLRFGRMGWRDHSDME